MLYIITIIVSKKDCFGWSIEHLFDNSELHVSRNWFLWCYKKTAIIVVDKSFKDNLPIFFVSLITNVFQNICCLAWACKIKCNGLVIYVCNWISCLHHKYSILKQIVKDNYLIVTKPAIHFPINRLEYVFSVLSLIVKSFHI